MCVDQLEDDSTGVVSDVDWLHVIADNFTVESTMNVTSVTWYGIYASDNTPPASDVFMIIFRDDNGGEPGTAVATYGPIDPGRVATGGDVVGYDTYEYVYDLPTPATLTGPGLFYLQIYNDTTGDSDTWYWETGFADSSVGIAGDYDSTTIPESWVADTYDFAFTLICSVSGVDEIDQDQPSGPTHMAGFSQTDLAQSFMQTNANISGAGILLQPGIGSSDTVTIQLWDALPNAGGTMLTEASTTGTAGEWVDVFWTAVAITPATTYYLVFTGNTTLGIAGDTGNPYPDGNAYANSGYSSFPSFDYTFRTYYNTGF